MGWDIGWHPNAEKRNEEKPKEQIINLDRT